MIQRKLENMPVGQSIYLKVNYNQYLEGGMMKDYEFSQADILYEDEITINEIKSIDYNSLKTLSQQFRISYESIEQEFKEDNYKNSEKEYLGFHEAIVILIAKIQPCKVELKVINKSNEGILAEYFNQDNKSQLRAEARKKNIIFINHLSLNEQYELFSNIKENIQKFKRAILIRQSQLAMIFFIEDSRQLYSKEEFIRLYQENYKELQDFRIPLQKCLLPINYKMISKMLEFQCDLFEKINQKILKVHVELEICLKCYEEGANIKSKQSDSIKTLLLDLKIMISKLQTLLDLFPHACIKSKEDLFSYDLVSDRWKKLFSEGTICYKLYGEPNKINQSFDHLKSNLNFINATMNIMNQSKQNSTKFSHHYESIMKILKCAVYKDKAQYQAQLLIAQPEDSLAKEIWNLPEKKQFKAFIELMLPYIEFSEHIYIPRIAKKYFFQRIQNKNAKVQLPAIKIQKFEEYLYQLRVQKGHQQRLSLRINSPFTLEINESTGKDQARQLNFFEKQVKKMNAKIKNMMKGEYETPKAVIFHIHGGGFISMSSFIHQTYTRKWANELKVPIVSVDYGKAPQCPYPEGLYDCFEAYLWTIKYFEQVYLVKPQKIILVGDSAGGNLVAALTNLLIQWGIRKPDGIVLVYPALNLNYIESYSPSMLTALNDMILPHTFLKICLKSYLKEKDNPSEDYFISPSFTPPHILQQYPPTKMFVGSKDPFHDQCCRFAQKLSAQSPFKVQLLVFEEFPHGFLQFDMKNQPQLFCRQATKQVQSALKLLLEQ